MTPRSLILIGCTSRAKEAEAIAGSSALSDCIEAAYFYFGFFAQSPLVRRHASRGTEAHVPVAMNAGAELPAAVITALSWDAYRKFAPKWRFEK
jgi:hypothetical protein